MADKGGAEPQSVLSWTQDNAIKLAACLCGLKKKNLLTYKQLVIDCLAETTEPDCIALAQQRLSRWFRHVKEPSAKWQMLAEAEFRSVTAYAKRLQRDTMDGASFPDDHFDDAAFHGMTMWLRSSSRNLLDLQRSFPGVYTIYRPSLT